MKLRDIGEDRLLGQLLSRLSLGKKVVNGPVMIAPWWKLAITETSLYSRPIALSQVCTSCQRRTPSTSAGKR